MELERGGRRKLFFDIELASKYFSAKDLRPASQFHSTRDEGVPLLLKTWSREFGEIEPVSIMYRMMATICKATEIPSCLDCGGWIESRGERP